MEMMSSPATPRPVSIRPASRNRMGTKPEGCRIQIASPSPPTVSSWEETSFRRRRHAAPLLRSINKGFFHDDGYDPILHQVRMFRRDGHPGKHEQIGCRTSLADDGLNRAEPSSRPSIVVITSTRAAPTRDRSRPSPLSPYVAASSRARQSVE